MITLKCITPTAIIGLLIIAAIVGVHAEIPAISDEEINLTNSSPQMNETGAAISEYGNPAGKFSPDQDSQNLILETEETPVIFNGTEHPNEETDVTSSTPSGNPLIPRYAFGGVNIDIGVHLMEGRGTDNNTSSEMSLQDHTSAFGYITTIQKEFHYVSGVTPA
jgi:hypothetical protein